ncbi:hypothetical protein DVH05_026203 [Phytophthora capsici]|nr:hypothetical protein DVH05_026203 [Phytophthora capsici]
MLSSPYDLPLDFDDLDATILLEDAEALLAEELHPRSPISTSDDQDAEELASINKHNKPRRANEIKRRQICRRREKRGREELRRQVVELNDELVRLRHSKETEITRFNAAQTPTFWFWKAVAIQQRHERSLAEEERRALTVSAHTQATYIRTLATVMRTQQDQAVRGVEKQRYGVSEPQLFDTLIQALDTECAPADEMFQNCRSTPQFEVRKPDGTLEYSQFYKTETIPLSLFETCCFLWQISTGHHRGYQDYKRCVDVRDPENTFARTYRNIITLENGVNVSVRNRLVTRRYDKERVSAWKLICEGEGVHNGFQFDETAWLTLKASELGTVIEMCIRRTPMHFTSAMPRDRERFEQAMHQLLDKTRDEILASLQGVIVEDVLAHLD